MKIFISQFFQECNRSCQTNTYITKTDSLDMEYKKLVHKAKNFMENK